MSGSPTRAHVKRIVRAPAADIFDAWTDPAAMAQWMTPVGTATAEVDLRVGGQFRLVMADAPLRIEHTGEYRVIQPPHLLVFTWRSEFTGMYDTLVTVRLTERGVGETEVELTRTSWQLTTRRARTRVAGVTCVVREHQVRAVGNAQAGSGGLQDRL